MLRVLAPLVLLISFPVVTLASTLENPDRYPSLLLGTGYDWVDAKIYQTDINAGDTPVGTSDWGVQRFFGTLTLPTSPTVSFLLSVARVSDGEPSREVAGELYVREFSTSANVAVRFYIR